MALWHIQYFSQSRRELLDSVVSKLENLALAPESVADLVVKNHDLIDGRGVERIAKEIAKL